MEATPRLLNLASAFGGPKGDRDIRTHAILIEAKGACSENRPAVLTPRHTCKHISFVGLSWSPGVFVWGVVCWAFRAAFGLQGGVCTKFKGRLHKNSLLMGQHGMDVSSPRPFPAFFQRANKNF